MKYILTMEYIFTKQYCIYTQVRSFKSFKIVSKVSKIVSEFQK